jgi:Chaperone of endosialidase
VQALNNNTTGVSTTANGYQALYSNTGDANTANGYHALLNNTTGNFNNAVGADALSANVGGLGNNAVGESALFSNIKGSGNTAVGDQALENNDSTGANLGNVNTAVGAGALFSNTDGDSNNAVGVNALGRNVDGRLNNAVGFWALGDNVSGVGNTAIGDYAGAGNTSGNFNTYIGVGWAVVDRESDTIRIGDPTSGVACFIGGIFGQTAAGGSAVFIDSNGKLGTLTSSARFKDEIKAMENASESILALKPVTFRYKKEIDAKGTPQFGLVAEEVAKVNPDLVLHDARGELSTVRYEAVNAMLPNEFLKEHRNVVEQQITLAERKTTIAEQQKQIDALTAGLQKVSAAVELNKLAATQVADNR